MPGEGSNEGKVTFCPGGVSMNIARSIQSIQRALEHNYTAIRLISVVGDDPLGQDLLQACTAASISTEAIVQIPGSRSASVVMVFDSKGGVEYSIADVSILEDCLTPAVVDEKMSTIKEGEVVVLDGDLSEQAIVRACELAARKECLVVFDPATEIKSKKCIPVLRYLTFMTPNLTELKRLAQALSQENDYMCHDCKGPTWDKVIVQSDQNASERVIPNIFKVVRACVQRVLESGVKNLLVTGGHHGVAMYRIVEGGMSCTHCPPIISQTIASVSGAGDSLLAGFLVGLCARKTSKEALGLGVASAWEALQTHGNVPENIDPNRLRKHLSQSIEVTKEMKMKCGCCCRRCCDVNFGPL
jgi:pseudouridine kinase